MENSYDVIVLGGGLAGLTLSVQLKLARPEIRILVLEKRESEAATAAHKVGESTVELGTYYLREVLKMTTYLEKHELPKHGLRFFFPSHHKEDIVTRVELGPRDRPPVPSHQLDRGTLENELVRRTRELGTEVVLGARVKDLNLDKQGQEVIYVKNKEEVKVKGLWVVDASSRISILKRKLKFEKEADHAACAVWWRLKGVIDVGDWTDNKKWQAELKPGLRLLSTVHFMDKGYWVWVIPLGSKNTSIGIVADPAIHPFDTYNTYEKAMKWLQINEPLCYKMLEPKTPELMDFMILRHYAHDSERLFSEDRWAVTGEAGAFLDPLYSPGTDFIAMSNGYLSDLILRDLQGEDISMRAAIYEKTHLTLFRNWLPVYQDKYPLMGRTQVMVAKILWDWTTYWSVPCLLYTNNALTDLKMLKEFFSSATSLGRKFGELNKRMQDMFVAWGPHDNEVFSNKYVDPLEFSYMLDFQRNLSAQLAPAELVEKITANMKKLEQVAAEIFRLVSHQLYGTPLDMKVDPYKISLQEGADVGQANGLSMDPMLAKEVRKMWFYKQTQAVV